MERNSSSKEKDQVTRLMHSRKRVLSLLKGRVENPRECELMLLRRAKLFFPNPSPEEYQRVAIETLGEATITSPGEKDRFSKEVITNLSRTKTSNLKVRFDEKQNNKRKFQVMIATEGLETNRGLECTKCGKKRVTYYTLQTRRGDEGSTVFYSCMNCGSRWKE